MTIDEEHELLIEGARREWEAARGPKELRRCFENFRALVAQRSPEQVRKLELKKGIAK